MIDTADAERILVIDTAFEGRKGAKLLIERRKGDINEEKNEEKGTGAFIDALLGVTV